MSDDARALAVFAGAVELDPAERSRYLEAECAGDAALRARVEAMLRADAVGHEVLDQTPGALFADPRPPRHSDRLGLRVGPYRLVSELGRGGMGVVYLAQRSDVGARVAIKLLAGSHATSERRARFEYERRVLARLEHPHIARFLDAGVTDDGTLWLALEHVEGRPLLDHCDAHRLGVRQRIALIEEVGEAVAYAHLNLLVHRDLKPSNIIVADPGGPKLLDFGIAKLLAEDVATGAITQDPMASPMTPEYASPEQVRGEAITTASDVYQLGILLYEVLTGRRPATPDGEPLRPFARASCKRFARPSDLVATEVRPSQVAAGPTDRTAAELSALRQASPRQLRRQLAGDVDAIIDKAMRCTPGERYGSAQELVDDLRRHRKGRPIHARAPSWAYRTASLVRRHTVSVALTTAIALLITASALLFFLQARAVTLQRDRAERVSQVLERLVLTRGPARATGDSVRAAVLREVMTQGRTNLSDDPEGWGRILAIVAGVLEEEGQTDTAITLWREVIAAMQPRVPADDPVLLDMMGRLGVALVTRGEFDAGLRQLEVVLRRARALSPVRSADLAGSLYDAGFGRQIAGDDGTARRLYLEALGLLASLPDSGGSSYDRILLNLGYIADRKGDPDAAEALFRSALARRRARDGAEHDRTLNALTSLARVLIEQERLDEADGLSAAALRGRRHVSPAPSIGLADALLVRARYLVARGAPGEGEALAREALAMHRQLVGDGHFVVGFALGVVADAVAAQNRLAEAAELQRGAVGRYRSAAGNRHPGTVRALIQLAGYEHRLGRIAEAERLYREAVPVLDSIVEGRAPLAPVLSGLGTLLARTGRCADAAPYLRRAAALSGASGGGGKAWAEEARSSLAECTAGG